MSGTTPHRKDFGSDAGLDEGHERYVEGEFGSGSTSYPTHYDESGELRRAAKEGPLHSRIDAAVERPGRNLSAHFERESGRESTDRSDDAALSDNRIWEKVCLALAEDPFIDASAVNVVVENGIVELHGSVRDAAMRERIMSTLSLQWCIRGIEDNLVFSR